MKKHFTVFAMAGLLLAACETKTEKQETTIVTETETIDPAVTEMDNTRTEIERATNEVDSLLNQI